MSEPVVVAEGQLRRHGGEPACKFRVWRVDPYNSRVQELFNVELISDLITRCEFIVDVCEGLSAGAVWQWIYDRLDY